MKIEDYHSKISLFYETNPHLTHDELAVVLTADLMYKDLPDDLRDFRKKYAHLDPSVLEGAHEGITFLRIAEATKPPGVLKDRLNAYLNVKFHDITNIRNYEDNTVLFRKRSEIASRVIEEILARDPDFAEALFLKAQLLWEGFEDREAARKCLLKIIKVEPDKRAVFHRWALNLYHEISGKRAGEHLQH